MIDQPLVGTNGESNLTPKWVTPTVKSEIGFGSGRKISGGSMIPKGREDIASELFAKQISTSRSK